MMSTVTFTALALYFLAMAGPSSALPINTVNLIPLDNPDVFPPGFPSVLGARFNLSSVESIAGDVLNAGEDVAGARSIAKALGSLKSNILREDLAERQIDWSEVLQDETVSESEESPSSGDDGSFTVPAVLSTRFNLSSIESAAGDALNAGLDAAGALDIGKALGSLKGHRLREDLEARQIDWSEILHDDGVKGSAPPPDVAGLGYTVLPKETFNRRANLSTIGDDANDVLQDGGAVARLLSPLLKHIHLRGEGAPAARDLDLGSLEGSGEDILQSLDGAGLLEPLLEHLRRADGETRTHRKSHSASATQASKHSASPASQTHDAHPKHSTSAKA